MPSDPKAVALVVAAAENGVIGRDNDLPWRIPSDLARFKALTMGGTLIMGRRTFQSIGRPLPGRRTIVVTSTAIDGVEHAGSLAEAIARAQSEVFLVGGANIYAEGLAHADRIYLTRVHARPDGDVHLPPLDGFLRVASEAGVRTERDEHAFTFETWLKR